MVSFFDSPEQFLRLKEPAKVLSIVQLGNKLAEETENEDLQYVISMISSRLLDDVEERPLPKIEKETITKLAKKLYKELEEGSGISLDQLLSPEMLKDLRIIRAFSLMLVLPQTINDMASGNDMDALNSNVEKLSKLYAILYLFDDFYGTRLRQFIDSLYDIDGKLKFDEAFYRDNIHALLTKKPDLFRF